MLQQARKSESRSFLREIEFALVLIQKESDRLYFLKKLAEVNERRNDQRNIHTGERAVKSEILTYLNQKGHTKTANVWARAISYDKKDIEKLLKILQVNLEERGIEGILEIHLQDREINSPHIQFVGNKADEAELVIAQVLVALKYETSLESAMSKRTDFEPYWKKNKRARHPKRNELKDTMQLIKTIQKRRNDPEEIDKFIEECNTKMEEIKKSVKRKMQSDRLKRETHIREKKFESIFKRMMDSNTNGMEALIRMRNRRLHRRRR